jgi:hypothetical protein
MPPRRLSTFFLVTLRGKLAGRDSFDRFSVPLLLTGHLWLNTLRGSNLKGAVCEATVFAGLETGTQRSGHNPDQADNMDLHQRLEKHRTGSIHKWGAAEALSAHARHLQTNNRSSDIS